MKKKYKKNTSPIFICSMKPSISRSFSQLIYLAKKLNKLQKKKKKHIIPTDFMLQPHVHAPSL